MKQLLSRTWVKDKVRKQIQHSKPQARRSPKTFWSCRQEGEAAGDNAAAAPLLEEDGVTTSLVTLTCLIA